MKQHSSVKGTMQHTRCPPSQVLNEAHLKTATHVLCYHFSSINNTEYNGLLAFQNPVIFLDLGENHRPSQKAAPNPGRPWSQKTLSMCPVKDSCCRSLTSLTLPSITREKRCLQAATHLWCLHLITFPQPMQLQNTVMKTENSLVVA